MTAPAPTTSPALRVCDREREQLVDVLRDHAAQGRLTLDELAERVERAYAARTQGELDALVRDLPAPAPGEVVARDTARAPGCGDGHGLAPYLAVNVLLIAIWALTGAGYFWPIWPLLGWGIGIVSKRLSARPVRVAFERGHDDALPR